MTSLTLAATSSFLLLLSVSDFSVGCFKDGLCASVVAIELPYNSANDLHGWDIRQIYEAR